MKFNRFFILAFCLLFSCNEPKEIDIRDFFSMEGDVFLLGEYLTDLSFGLHDIEISSSAESTLLIGIHGSNSDGYEWVYPLKTLNNDTNVVSFFRWDDGSCPDPSIDTLLSSIKTKLDQSPNLNKVILIGHSYGGLLVTILSEVWDIDVPLHIHSVAGPLKGMGLLSSECNYQPPSSLGAGINLHQWRTIQELDGAYNNLDYDPQVVDIKNSNVTRLPKTYKGNKLGHNWSISWVADEISREK
jgi:pimeloyl-ACP methyl ester carboxylesterase